MPVDVANGYFEVVDDNTIRLISANQVQAYHGMPDMLTVILCQFLESVIHVKTKNCLP